jgi:stage II sporulation protein R
MAFILIAASINLFCGCQKKADNDILRIHIIANSNSRLDQDIKHEVKDCIVEKLSEALKDAKDKNQAKRIIKDNEEQLLSLSNQTLEKKHADYLAKMEIKLQEFPARVYDDIVFEKGVYEAVIITLGKGQGDNWWCVAFPPLCFIPSDGNEIRYKSIIMEIINNAN